MFPEYFCVILQIQSNKVPFINVNKQERFLTHFCETNDNLFHGETIATMDTIATMGQVPKNIGNVILSQF